MVYTLMFHFGILWVSLISPVQLFPNLRYLQGNISKILTMFTEALNSSVFSYIVMSFQDVFQNLS